MPETRSSAKKRPQRPSSSAVAVNPQTNDEEKQPKRPRSAPATNRRKRDEERQRVHVAVRVRPQSEDEVTRQSVPVVDVISESEVLVRETLSSSVDYLRANRLKTRQFAFDSAFGRESAQDEVYNASCASLVVGVASQQFNATCFCYGATGAGKTYTMLGTEGNPGVMVLALHDLYSRLQGTGSSVTISFIEIYNEQVRDLLSSSSKDLVLREDPRKGVTVSGMTELEANSVDGVMDLLHKGNARRTTEPTNKNATSSRSHAILQVTVEGQSGRLSKLSMIDLAGSERTLATESRTARNTEGAHINKSLLALSSCISSLVDGRKHIPYRDSKLTQLLKDSLGGSCLTAMIANVSPSHLAFGDTSNTLHWASRAKHIRSTTHLNEEAVDALKQRSIAEANNQRRSGVGSPSPAKLQDDNRRLTDENQQLKTELEEVKRKLKRFESFADPAHLESEIARLTKELDHERQRANYLESLCRAEHNSNSADERQQVSVKPPLEAHRIVDEDQSQRPVKRRDSLRWQRKREQRKENQMRSSDSNPRIGAASTDLSELDANKEPMRVLTRSSAAAVRSSQSGEQQQQQRGHSSALSPLRKRTRALQEALQAKQKGRQAVNGRNGVNQASIGEVSA